MAQDSAGGSLSPERALPAVTAACLHELPLPD